MTTKKTRYRVAYICMEQDGKYSVDAPCLDQGGTVGLGTTYVESLEDAVKLLEAKLKYFHDFHVSQIEKKNEKEGD
jgi:hypothetical protein